MVSGTRVALDEAIDIVSGLGERLHRVGGPGLGTRKDEEAMATLSRPEANFSATPPSSEEPQSSPGPSGRTGSATRDSEELKRTP